MRIYLLYVCVYVYTVHILTHHEAHLRLSIIGKRQRSDLRAGTYLAKGMELTSPLC